jgi:hypothetical protein
MNFPPITAFDLNRKKYHLPQDLEGQLNLLILGFATNQQLEVDTWIPSLTALEKKHPNFRFYEIPVGPELNVMQKWMIDTGMRYNIPDLKTRAKTITVYTDMARLLQSLSIQNTNTIQLVLCMKNGGVIWKSEGAFNQLILQELEKQILM